MNNALRKLLICFFSCVTLLGFSQNTIGVLEINENIQEGYTLFAPNSSNATFLIDNCGNVIKEWFSLKKPGLSTYLLPNGDLIRTRREANNVFFAGGTGGGIEIFDWNGSPKWEFVLSTEQSILHHDIAVLPNGR